MTPQAIAGLRLRNQQISSTKQRTSGELVSWLGMLQAQDYTGVKWSLGARLHIADLEVEQAIADKLITRTWLARGTLHMVATEDIRWMLELLAPRTIAGLRLRDSQLELDDASFARANQALVKAFQSNRQLTRSEAMQAMEQAGVATSNQRGYHLLHRAAQSLLICFGPVRGKQQTFVLLDDWVRQAKSLPRDVALAKLAERYFLSRGPATIQDFAWWSGLNTADARAGLEAIKPQVIRETIAGQAYWLPPTPTPKHPSPAAYLLPGFDEYLLGYKERNAVLDPAYKQAICPGNNGMFMPTIIIGGRVAGIWKRTLKKDRVVVALSPFTPLKKADLALIHKAAQQYGVFLKLDAEVV